MNAVAQLRAARDALDSAILAAIRARGSAYIVEIARDLDVERPERLRSCLARLESHGVLVSEYLPPGDCEQMPGRKSGLGRRFYRLEPTTK